MSDPKPLPRLQQLSPTLIDQWIQTPGGTELTAPITKDDLDNLYFAINELTKATHETQQSLIHLSNNQLNSANEAMHKAQFSTAESANTLNRFFEGIVTKHLLNSRLNSEP